ncbi:DUF971 domain-containing protein [Uliginosibacterium sp. H3]|uniref:DUF971 domain-containing protein n=1 Tax=Uliginosibacterium silvisoli TaxID=3114758 RepID=A0ABU6JZZ8_9RHOO|nr:DUF971 domain-containing protein [Uliginosibacterium sp. H3]
MSAQILSIRTDDAKGILGLDLDDGTQGELSYARLRAACRCAECTALQRRGGNIDAAEVVLNAIAPVGGHALNLHFSDGHTRGIYPFPYLVELVMA